MSETMPGAKSVSLGLFFPTGSRFESAGNNGISHFIEHLVFKGTPSRSAEDVNREIDLLGGASNAYTSKETLCLHSRVLPGDLGRLLALFADLASHALPSGVEPEIERERAVILAEIAAVEDSPEDLVGELCDRAYFGEHPLALPVAGSAPAVSRMTPADLRSHFAQHIVAEGMLIAAAGQVDHDALVELAKRELSEVKPGTARPGLVAPRVRAVTQLLQRDFEQVHLCLSAPGVSRGEHRRRVAELLSIIVGDGYSSRLFREVRDRRGLAYSIYTSLASYVDSGSFNVYAAVAPDRLDQTLEVVRQVLSDVRDGGITEPELSLAKQHLCTSTRLAQESSSARMSFLAEQVVLGDEDLRIARELELVEEIQLPALWDLARELLSGPLALAAVGPLSGSDLPTDGWELSA